MQVVAYDADTGMYAARLWWMLRWMGHDAVAVLDGGLARWQREGHPVRGGVESSTPGSFHGSPRPGWRLTADEVLKDLGNRASPARRCAHHRSAIRGIGETLDPVGGHIPGAANYFFQQNLADGQDLQVAGRPAGRSGQTVLKGHDAKRRRDVLRVGRDGLP